MPEWFQMHSERKKVPSALSFLSPSPRGSCGLSSVKGISQVGPFAQQRLRNTNPAVYTPWWLILLPAPQLHTAVSSLAFQPEVDQDFQIPVLMRPKSPLSNSPGLTRLLFYLSFILQTGLIYQWDSIVFLHVIRVSIINQVIIQLDKQSIQWSFFWSNDNDVSVRERKEVFCALASKTSYRIAFRHLFL